MGVLTLEMFELNMLNASVTIDFGRAETVTNLLPCVKARNQVCDTTWNL